MKLNRYHVRCTATGQILGTVLAYNERDARRSAAAYGWVHGIRVTEAP